MIRNKYLMVDAANRMIDVPSDEKLFGVEFDEKGTRKYFKCPKIVGDNIDLSNASVFINVQNASQQSVGKDRYAVENFKVAGDMVTFEWVLGRKVTAHKGTVRFNICVVTKDGREWNTTYAEGTVKEGLELLNPEEVETRGSDYLGALTADATAVPEVILAPYTAYKNGEKIEGTYVPLDTGSATATVDNIEKGMTAFVDGKEVTGTLPVNNSLTYASPAESDLSYTAASTPYGTMKMVKVNPRIYPSNSGRKMILEGDQQRCSIAIDGTYFGDATTADVRKGKRFTSINGLKILGTLEPTGKTVKTGTLIGIGTDPVKVQTGLSSVEKFVMYYDTSAGAVKENGVCAVVYENNKTQGYAASYGSYLTTLSLSAGTVTTSAGVVTYTPADGKSVTNTMTDITYNWIAIGS